MKYRLIIDKHAEEEVIAIVHSPSSFTQQLENLVCTYSGADSISQPTSVHVGDFASCHSGSWSSAGNSSYVV